MRKILWMVGIFLNSFAFSQVSEGFNDGELLHQPEWIGDTGRFFVNANKQLQSKVFSKSDTAMLATGNDYLLNTVWEFYVQLNIDPSTSNQLRVYLAGDQLGLDSIGNGYFLQIGESGANDSYDLYRKSGRTITKIIDGLPKIRERTDTLRAYFMVIHRTDGYWELFSRTNTILAWTSEGFTFDRTFLSTKYFGLAIKHTATRSDKFIIDNVLIYPYEADSIKPFISKVESINDSTIRLTCSKELDTAILQPDQFKINGQTFNFIQFDKNDLYKIDLSFQGKLKTGINTIEIPIIQDLLGNSSKEIQIVNLNYTPEISLNKHSIFISEIMADPSPAEDLPEVEYIEVYNSTDSTINLENWEYHCSNSKIILPEFNLKSKEFVILCKATDTSSMLVYGNCIGLKVWPSLVNTGAKLKLIEPKGKLIDEVNYETSWYKNNTKMNGGFSLEYIHPNKTCEGIYAWEASGSPSGGTPGKPNYAWEKPIDDLYIKQIEILNDSSIYVRFNRTPDTIFTKQTSNYIIRNSNERFKKVKYINNEKNELVLTSASKFRNKQAYRIIMENIYTCEQELLQENEFTLFYINNDDTSKIKINEVYVDPFPSNGLAEAEYVELYNASENTVDLSGYSFVIGSSSYILPKFILKKDEYVIICSANDTSSFKIYGRVIGISAMVNLSNTVASITIKNKVGRTIDRITYRQSWYRDNTKTDGGWSIELIDPFNKCDFINKWAASANVKGGTPGQKNSIADFHIDQRDLSISLFQNINGTTFKIILNKAIDGRDINPAQVYFVGPQMKLYFPQKVQIDSPYYKIFTITFSKAMPVGKYNLICQYLPSCSRADTNLVYPVYINNVSVSLADIMLSELMPDPSPSISLPEAEYIELYNKSNNDYYNLNFYLCDTKDSLLISIDEWKAKSYILFCQKDFRNSWDKNVKVYPLNKMISLSNESDSVFILNEKKEKISSMEYNISQFPYDKRDGGYSINRIDDTWNCESKSAWQISLNPAGGSPGKENSRLPEYNLSNIELKNIHLIDNKNVYLEFNTGIEERAEINIAIEGSTKQLKNNIENNAVRFILPEKIKSGEMIKLKLEFTNCLGMKIDTTIIVYNKYIPKHNDVLINEILFNPLPGGVDFVEIYNNSDSIIDLQDIYLSDGKNKISLKTSIKTKNEYCFINPNEYRVLSLNNEDIIGKFNVVKPEHLVQLSKMPSLNDDGGTIIISNENDETIDMLDYSEDYHINWIKDIEGRSLERRKFYAETNIRENWSSATDDIGKASPTGKNSQFTNSSENKNVSFWLSKDVYYPSKENSDNNLELNYNIESITAFIRIKVFDVNGLYIGNIANEKSIRNTGIVSWDFSVEGSRIGSGTYILSVECYSENGVNQYYKIPFVLHY